MFSLRNTRSLRLTEAVYTAIARTIGTMPPEQGGALGAQEGSDIISAFYYDETADRTMSTYSPDTTAINRMLADDWEPRGVSLCGFTHSHPARYLRPSVGDLTYARRIMKALDLDELWLPIVASAASGRRFEIHPFVAKLTLWSVDLTSARLVVEGEELTLDYGAAASGVDSPNTVSVAAEIADKTTPSADVHDTSAVPAHFSRIQTAVDLAHLHRARVIGIGAGGAAGFYESLVRMGVGEFVIIDPGDVEAANLSTQLMYREDIGRPKVDALADRLIALNPACEVVGRRERIEEFTEEEFTFLTRASMRNDGKGPTTTLVCAMTDDFFAQAKANRLALHCGVPSIAAQVYAEGRGAEVTFMYPGRTHACHRCMLASRYDAYLVNGYKNEVGSAGTPLFTTERLNALKGTIALALLHAGTGHPRWERLLELIGDRTMVQLRLDPDIAETLGLSIFNTTFEHADQSRILTDEPVWISEEPVPNCPDCGGTGDLLARVGSFTTAVLRPTS